MVTPQGNYPYPSAYILNGAGTLPAFPMRVACEAMAEKGLSDAQLLSGLATAAGVFYNYTGNVPCFNYRQAVVLLATPLNFSIIAKIEIRFHFYSLP